MALDMARLHGWPAIRNLSMGVAGISDQVSVVGSGPPLIVLS